MTKIADLLKWGEPKRCNTRNGVMWLVDQTPWLWL
jgi:hypothetical protein